MKKLLILIVLVSQVTWRQNIFNIDSESIAVETAFTLNIDLSNNEINVF